MAISYWTKLNPDIVKEATTKQFYNRYLYKMVLELYGGRSINIKSGESIAEYLNERIAVRRTYNYGGSWHQRYIKDLQAANPDHLELVKTLKEEYSDQVKFRVEEPLVQIYAETEDMLKVVAAALGADLQKKIKVISCPNSGTEQSLKDGKILVDSYKTPYRYKIMIRDGAYHSDVKHRVLDYLTAIGDQECRVSKGTAQMLKNQNTYIWGGFFYANDLSLVTFIKLIHPDIIGKIHELEHRDH